MFLSLLPLPKCTLDKCCTNGAERLLLRQDLTWIHLFGWGERPAIACGVTLSIREIPVKQAFSPYQKEFRQDGCY